MAAACASVYCEGTISETFAFFAAGTSGSSSASRLLGRPRVVLAFEVAGALAVGFAGALAGAVAGAFADAAVFVFALEAVTAGACFDVVVLVFLETGAFFARDVVAVWAAASAASLFLGRPRPRGFTAGAGASTAGTDFFGRPLPFGWGAAAVVFAVVSALADRPRRFCGAVAAAEFFAGAFEAEAAFARLGAGCAGSASALRFAADGFAVTELSVLAKSSGVCFARVDLRGPVAAFRARFDGILRYDCVILWEFSIASIRSKRASRGLGRCRMRWIGYFVICDSSLFEQLQRPLKEED